MLCKCKCYMKTLHKKYVNETFTWKLHQHNKIYVTETFTENVTLT